MKQEYKEDQLLQCLVLYTKLYHKPFTAEALVANLPLEKGRSTPELFSQNKPKGMFSRAAKQAGLKTKIVKRTLNEVSNLTLPAIAVLKGNKAVILESIDYDHSIARVIMPEMDDVVTEISINRFEEEYVGYMFYLKKEYDYHSREHDLVDSHDGHWFWDTLKLSKKIYQDAIVASLIINIFILVTPLFTMNVYDRVVPNGAIDTMWVLVFGVSLIYIFDSMIKFLRTYFLDIASKKNDIIMSSKIFEKVMNLRIDASKSTVGTLANTIKDFDSVKNFFSTATLTVIIDIPFIIIFLIVVYLIGGYIVIIPMVIAFLVLLYTFIIRKPLQKSILESSEASNNKNSVLIESLVNIETIKTLGAQGHAQWVWEESIGEISSKSVKSKLLSASISIVNGFLIQFATVAIIVVGVYMISEKQLTMGALIAIVMIAGRAISPVAQIASLISNYETTKLAYESVEKLMALPVERESGREYVHRPNINGNIEFKNVSFAYSEDDKNAIENISFTINEGDKIAILGKIGSGKTTIEKLILGLYRATSGSILIDGIDITQIDTADLRTKISYVPQEIVLFKGTIKENLVFRSFGADDAAILKCSKLSGVDEFIKRHPKGYDMQIGELGIGLSGGQKQSIAIARAFIKESPVVLLDEPTSLMDGTTETMIKKNLKEYCLDKTLILSTHKTSMLDLVDKIMIIDSGRIVAFGEKNEVLQKFMK